MLYMIYMIYLYVLYCIITYKTYIDTILNVSDKTKSIFFLFPNLSKNSQPRSTCAVCSKFL